MHRAIVDKRGVISTAKVLRAIAALICLTLTSFAQTKSAATANSETGEFPKEIIVARHFFFDFGPPSDFYEIFTVRESGRGAVIEKISLTPAGDRCVQPATIGFASVTRSENVETLLGERNPCSISERKLRKERSRRKKGLVFSGADISFQMACSGKSRTVRAEVLDRDMFDAAAQTPENTSWSMQVMSRLDAAAGPNAAERPIFGADTQPPPGSLPEQTRKMLASGGYDPLFPGAPHKPSTLYQAAQVVPAKSSVVLVSSSPISPDSPILPAYPPIARLAHIEGNVAIAAVIDASGHTARIESTSGHPMLAGAAKEAVKAWRFSTDRADQQIKAEFHFALNCPSTPSGNE